MEKRYKNMGYFMMLLIPISFFGFYKTSYFTKFPNHDNPMDVALHFHFVMACLWILMLIIQPILIKNKKNTLHKTIGNLSYFVFPLLILSMLILIANRIEEKGAFMAAYAPMADTVLLISFYSLAIYNKKNAAKHMRFMIGTAFVFLAPTVGRIGPILLGFNGFLTQHILYGMIYVMLILLMISDKRNHRNYAPYRFILVFFFLHQLGFYLQ